jgi:hypothetical protein
MTNLFLFILVVLSSFLELTFPARALPAPVPTSPYSQQVLLALSFW